MGRLFIFLPGLEATSLTFDSLQSILSIFMTVLIFLSLGSNVKWKYSLKMKAFSFLYINNVHFMCTIDFLFATVICVTHNGQDKQRHKLMCPTCFQGNMSSLQ